MDFLRGIFLEDMDCPERENNFIPPSDIEKPTPPEELAGKIMDDVEGEMEMWQEAIGLSARLNINNQRWGSKE